MVMWERVLELDSARLSARRILAPRYAFRQRRSPARLAPSFSVHLHYLALQHLPLSRHRPGPLHIRALVPPGPAKAS